MGPNSAGGRLGLALRGTVTRVLPVWYGSEVQDSAADDLCLLAEPPASSQPKAGWASKLRGNKDTAPNVRPVHLPEV